MFTRMTRANMTALLSMIREALADDRGQGMVEYGLILALIAVVCILVFTNLGSGIVSKITCIVSALGGSGSTC